MFFRDCYPRGQDVSKRDSTRYEICRIAALEKFTANLTNILDNFNEIHSFHSFISPQKIKEFYRCLILLNSQETRKDLFRISVAKDYLQNAAEICYLGKSI